ncbi:MAG: RNA 3'-terminal phosphate cyclase [archaeon]
MIELDGSFGEGGGSVFRQALALSILTGKEFRIVNIRKGRENPGLAPQHQASLEAAAKLCEAEVVGNYLGSTEVSFKPGEFKSGSYRIDIGTAGSITLLMQSLILPSIFSGKKVSFIIIGGTDVKWSQPFDYFNSVFLAQARRYADIEANLFKRGYYPKGGGEIRISINGRCSPEDAPSLLLVEQKHLLQMRGVSHASADLADAKVADRQAANAELSLRKMKVPIRISTQYSKSESTGSGITLWAVFGDDEIDQANPIVLGADSLGERGKKAELVGMEAAERLVEIIESGAAVDEYLADQLIPFIAVAGGVIRTTKITDHVRSNIYVAEKFLDSKFTIKENTISCEKQW